MASYPPTRCVLLLIPMVLGMACASIDDAQAPGDTPWRLIAELEYQREGSDLMTAAIKVTDGGAGFALFIETDGCVALSFLADAETTWVSDEGGADEHETRSSPIAGSGMLVHIPERPIGGDAVFRLRGLNCETMTRLPAGADAGPLRVWVRPLPEPVEVVRLPVIFHHGAFSTFSASSADLASAVGDLMRPAGIELELVATTQDELPSRITWSEGTPQELHALVPAWDPTVHVFFAGCVERVHPITRSRKVLDGVVPRVPGVGATGGGVFLRGRECGAGASGAIQWDQEIMTQRIAHELGHHLGLFHTVEVDGTLDDLDDTGDGTLMALRPADQPTFSLGQAARMRLHAQLLATPAPL